MNGLKFTWDSQKAAVNLKKHGISFEEAKTVFYDEFARLIPDPEHSNEEDRFILLGVSVPLRLLIVCHGVREDREIIRIISARKATKPEQRQYEDFRNEK